MTAVVCQLLTSLPVVSRCVSTAESQVMASQTALMLTKMRRWAAISATAVALLNTRSKDAGPKWTLP